VVLSSFGWVITRTQFELRKAQESHILQRNYLLHSHLDEVVKFNQLPEVAKNLVNMDGLDGNQAGNTFGA